MNESHVEKEVKFQVYEPEILLGRLKRQGARCLGKAFQHTIRMDDRESSLGKRDVALRVRSGFNNVVTVKRKTEVIGDAIAHREEYEAEVEDIEIFRKMFQVLGFDWERIMDKYRMDFEFHDTVVSLDELPFGIFAEIEGDDDKILEAAELLGFDMKEGIAHSYWKVFEDYKKANRLKGENIEFEKGYVSIFDKVDFDEM